MAGEAEGRSGQLEDSCGPGQGPGLVGSPDSSGNKVAAWLCVHAEVRPGWGSLFGGEGDGAFLPLPSGVSTTPSIL